MVRIGPMASPKFPLDRRELMAGLGAAALAPMWPAAGPSPRAAPRWRCRPKPTASPSRPDAPATPIWSLQGPELRFKRGETLDVAFGNELPVPAVLNWRGIDGVPAAEPLTAAPPLAAGGKDSLATAAAPRRDLPVRPRAARRRPGAAIAGTGAGRPGKRSRRRRSRRGAPDRGLAGPAGWNRDRARGPTRRTPCRSIRLTARLRSISQPGPTNASGSASSMAANALLLQSNWRSSRSASWPSTASRPSRSRPATARWCWRRAAGSMPSSM